MFECFIMENLLTAANTFHFEDDGAINIYICNNNGKHEPQQIDNILSSDNSVFQDLWLIGHKIGSLGTNCRYQIQTREDTTEKD